MPLAPAAAARTRVHRRAIHIEGFRREDGLFDIEAHLLDAKDFDYPLAGQLRRAGDPIHEMWLRITIDQELNILDAEAASDAVPYAGECERIAPAYKALIGLRIGPGFRLKLTERLGGVQGCTHLTELAAALATGAVQTLAGMVRDDNPNKRPLPIGQCHALQPHANAVRLYYPRWYQSER